MTDTPSPSSAPNPVTRALERPVRAMQIVMGWALIALCLATTYEILARKLFGLSLQGINEVGAYMLAISSAWGFSIALLQRAHSRVDFLFPRFPPALQALLNLITALALAGIAAFAAWQGWAVLADTLRWQATANTPLQTPMWIPQSLWLVGLVIFSAVSAACAVHALLLFLRDRRTLNRYYGPPSLKEQIELETQLDLPAETKETLR